MRIGIVRYWADRPVAEHEVIARLTAAAAARQHELIELNPDGSLLRDPSTTPELDLVMNLHYLSPKVLDLPHVGLLWNPIDFYHNFGFVPHFAHQVSHDYLATAGAPLVEQAFAPLRPDLFAEPLPLLNHGVPERYVAPERRQDRRLFYVGVNWEKVIGDGGRHSDLLGRLDDAGLTRIYGPRKIESFVPWEGYQTYQGDLPFDGWSVIEAISRAGIALVTSSAAHYRDGVMSCRPFEAAAAGVPLISERHPFMLEHFADAALFFDERAAVEEQAAQIGELIRQLNDDPDRAIDLAHRAQTVPRERFNLDDQLDELARWVAEREAGVDRESTVQATAVLVPVGEPHELLAWARANAAALGRFSDIVLAPAARSVGWERVEEALQDLLPSRVRADVPTRKDTGWSERAAQAAAPLQGSLAFLLGVEQLFAGFAPAVAAAGARGVAVLPSACVPNVEGVDVNDRYPTLLALTTSNWWSLPVSAVAVDAHELSELRRLLGPGLHLGVLAERALGSPTRGAEDFVPVARLMEGASGSRPWSVGELLGTERHRDAIYARALPAALTSNLPAGLFRDEVVPASVGLSTRLAGALRRTSLPKPVSEALITSARRVLKPRPQPK